jgi:hypothetical protein
MVDAMSREVLCEYRLILLLLVLPYVQYAAIESRGNRQDAGAERIASPQEMLTCRRPGT